MTLMTQAAFAARRGVGKSAVSNWKKAGFLVFGEGDDGKVYVDAERSEARLNARLDPMRGRPASGEAATAPELPIDDTPVSAAGVSTPRSLAAARAEVVEEDLFGRRMKNAQLAGELVPLIEMERRAAEMGRLVRKRGRAELRNVAERLAAATDVRVVMTILDEAHDKTCSALADAIAGGALGGEEEEGEEAEAVAEAA